MADKKITQLTNITGADLVDADEFVVVDISADETKAITLGELKTAFDSVTGFVRITGDTMTGDLTVPNVVVTGTVDGRDIATDGTKLDGIEANATTDQTAAQIKVAYESNADTNEFSDAEQTKLSGIATGADVTDTTNVTAAGALMDSEVTNLAQVKAFDSSDYVQPNANATLNDTTINGKLDIEEVYEKVTVQTPSTGTITFDTTAQAVELYTADQTANRTINFSNVNANLATGQSLSVAVLLTNGATPYYLNVYQVDGSVVTPKWQGGTAPAAGNANGIDSYSFTIIKTADATFTVLASQTQFA
tara:strand:+ start:4412 stop:5329 length:918 start_codon:yes stop_codon:yes gene_type:complete